MPEKRSDARSRTRDVKRASELRARLIDRLPNPEPDGGLSVEEWIFVRPEFAREPHDDPEACHGIRGRLVAKSRVPDHIRRNPREEIADDPPGLIVEVDHP